MMTKQELIQWLDDKFGHQDYLYLNRRWKQVHFATCAELLLIMMAPPTSQQTQAISSAEQPQANSPDMWWVEDSRLRNGKCAVCGDEACGYMCHRCWEISRNTANCSDCNGSGDDNSIPHEPGPCTECHGSGKRLQAVRDRLAALGSAAAGAKDFLSEAVTGKQP